jgi:hypothetical protein
LVSLSGLRGYLMRVQPNEREELPVAKILPRVWALLKDKISV